MTAAALRTRPLDAETFRAFRTGKSDDYGGMPHGFARFAKLLARAFAPLCATAPSFSVERIGGIDADEDAGSEAETISALLLNSDPRYMARVTIDKPLAFALCELLLGGVGNEVPYAGERPLSHIEKDFGKLFIGMVAENLPHAFTADPVAPFELHKPKADAVEEAPPFKPAARVSMIATIMGYSGDISIELSADLVSLGKLGPAGAEAAGGTQASGWTPQIASRIEDSELEVKAVLTSFQMTLEDIGRLLPGQLVRLPVSFSKPVTLESDGVVLQRARLGQQARRFCLSVL